MIFGQRPRQFCANPWCVTGDSDCVPVPASVCPVQSIWARLARLLVDLRRAYPALLDERVGEECTVQLLADWAPSWELADNIPRAQVQEFQVARRDQRAARCRDRRDQQTTRSVKDGDVKDGSATGGSAMDESKVSNGAQCERS